MSNLKEFVAGSDKQQADGIRLVKHLSSGVATKMVDIENKLKLSNAISELMDATVPANKCIMVGRLDDPGDDKVTYSDVYAVTTSKLVLKMRLCVSRSHR